MENVNDVPTITLPDILTFPEDGFLTEDFSQYIEDVDGDILEISVSGNEEISVDIEGYIVSLASTLNWFGTETITFSVEDGSGSSASDNVNVIVIIG